MAGNTVVSKLIEEAGVEKTWTIENFKDKHKLIVAAGASCYVDVGPDVRLRFFLRPEEKLSQSEPSFEPAVSKWYSLCAEVLQVQENAAVEVTASVYGASLYCSKLELYKKNGTISLKQSVGNVVEVINPFMSLFMPVSASIYDLSGNVTLDVSIVIKAKVFRLIETGN